MYRVDIPSKRELEESLNIRLNGSITVEAKKDIFFNVFGYDMIIPKGAKSDGASFPAPVRILLNKLDSKIIFFSFLHDYHYRTQHVPRLVADSIYKEGLRITKDTKTAAIFYAALRCCGWYGWGKNNKKGLETYPNAKRRLINHLCKRGG